MSPHTFSYFAGVTAVQCLLTLPALGQGLQLPIYEDFEATSGLFIEGGANSAWEWGVPDLLILSSAGSGERAWVTGLESNLPSSSDSYLQSAPLDFVGLTEDPTVQFLLAIDLNPTGNAFLEMSLDGQPFQRVGAAGDPGSLNWYSDAADQSWNGIATGINPWLLTRNTLVGAAGTTAVLRWRVNAGNSSLDEGIGVDRVQVFGTLVDVAVSGITLPDSGAAPLASPTQFEIKNLGSELVSILDVEVRVTGPVDTTLFQSFSVDLPPLEVVNLEIDMPIDLTLEGTYSVEILVNAEGDQVPENDAMTAELLHQQTVTEFPYAEDFESGSGQYFVAGQLPSWELGVPQANFIDTAASGASAWVTNLSGLANFGELSYVQSPPFDLSSFSEDPFLELRIRYSMQLFQGASYVEYSIDGGIFNRLGLEDDPGSTNWYNAGPAGDNSWSGSSPVFDGWIAARHLINGGAGHVVTLRFVFESDGLFTGIATQEGIGIDDIRIYEAPFGNGQPSLPGVALLEIGDSLNVLGFPPSDGLPGPYFASAGQAEGLSLRVEGPPLSPVAIFLGSLAVTALSLPAIGQVDILTPVLLGSGFTIGGISPFFFTTASGQFELSLTIPINLVGIPLAFQGLVPSLEGGLSLTNAVQVTFTP